MPDLATDEHGGEPQAVSRRAFLSTGAAGISAAALVSGAPDATVQKTLPGSTKTYTQAQIDDGFNPPDWYPQDHPPMPDVVAHGRKEADARACALCHLTSGGGHPESAGIAGLPVGYILRQMEEFKSGARKGARAVAMIPKNGSSGSPRARTDSGIESAV